MHIFFLVIQVSQVCRNPWTLDYKSMIVRGNPWILDYKSMIVRGFYQFKSMDYGRLHRCPWTLLKSINVHGFYNSMKVPVE